MSSNRFMWAVIILAGEMSTAWADDSGNKLVGTWVWRTPPDGHAQYWSIGRDGDKWTVKGWYKNGEGVETGSFVGIDPIFADGSLRFTHRFSKKHFNYKDNVPVLIKVDGEQVKYYWNPDFPKKSECLLQKVEEPKATAKEPNEPKTVANDPKEPKESKEPKSAKPENRFVGTWKGSIVNHVEIWNIRKADGVWSINGRFLSNGAEVGSFIGADIKEVDGTLTFTRRFVKNPRNSNFLVDLAIVVKPEGDNLAYSWSTNGVKGMHALEPYGVGSTKGSDSVKLPAEGFAKFEGVWTADVATGFRVVMQIAMKDGKIDVSANYYKKGAVAGAFIGENTTLTDGKITFTQKFTPKPVSSWMDGKFHTLEITGENSLKFSWKNGGTEHFTRVKK